MGRARIGQYSCMAIRIDPQQVLLWRTPNSLQFGAEKPAVVLENVSTAEERLIATLLSGISRSGLQMMADSLGFDELSLELLLTKLDPVLTGQRSAATPRENHRVTLCGTGPTAQLISGLLPLSAVTVTQYDQSNDAAPGHTPPDLAIVLAQFVIDPELHGRWLRRDIPHLPIVFGDRTVQIGPVITPGTGPCLFCFELDARDADSAWPALSAQLWGRSSPSETTLVSTQVAAIAVRLVLGQFEPAAPSQQTSSGAIGLQLDIATGRVSERRRVAHPECGCLFGAAGADQKNTTPIIDPAPSDPAPSDSKSGFPPVPLAR